MEALYYTPHADQTCSCRLCPHHCRIGPGKRGRCRTRYNDGGRLKALNYGQCTAIALDPIEKKPLYHFHRGRTILSLGSWGCNLSCQFCQNWEISQEEPPAQALTPEQARDLAIRYVPQGNLGLAYTYNEPTVWYEFIHATAPLVHKAGLYNIMVTNGFIEEEPLQELLPLIDAWNIDLKAFGGDFYEELCGGRQEAVCRTIREAAARSHVEVTTLIIPGKNDDFQAIEALSAWLASLNRDIPLHLTRYFPRYKLQLPPTPVETLVRCARISRTHLSHVHIGNVSDAEIQACTASLQQ